MKILLADDHALFRDGLSMSLSRLGEENLTVLQTGSCREALDMALQHIDLDLVLMDIEMPGESGLDAICKLKTIVPLVPIIMISANEDQHLIKEALKLGAKGFIPKSTTTSVLLSALRLVSSGGTYLPPQLLIGDESVAIDSSYALANRLTPRQKEVLVYLQQGTQNKIIADKMGLSESTIKTHVQGLFTILEAKNRSQVVSNAFKAGLF